MDKRPCPNAVNVNSPGRRSESGVRPIAPTTDITASDPALVDGHTWAEVEQLLRRMALNDPRRRLLDLACMRRDRPLAMAMLRQPAPRRGMR